MSDTARVYRLWAPIYDLVIAPLFGRLRGRSLRALALQAGECLLLPGVGTGLDLPLVPPGVAVVGYDRSPAMLVRAIARPEARGALLFLAEAGAPGLAPASVDAVGFNLILAVAPDGAAAFQAAWRALRPGGRAVIFDKFLLEGQVAGPLRRAAGRVVRLLATDINRRLSDILAGTPDVIVLRDTPVALAGFFRLIELRKAV
ncbi:MAG: methyltransferase domain-containing protein [Ardenticatenaceae bacterium]|nr:methyltransferase domain-containing protein [Ardenticatenaceae bacterium]HBY99505.1 phosphatidylethanolamine N-methyltransferase [Chloroflexota bacterium]